MIKQQLVINTLEEMQEFAHNFAIAMDVLLQDGNSLVVYLHGDLGVGKTFIAQNLISTLIPDSIVKSPTYSIVEEYLYYTGKKILHFDLYRLSSPEELEYLGIRDYVDTSALMLIEWPSNGTGYIVTADLELYIEIGPNIEDRIISFVSNSKLGNELLGKLRI